MGAFMSENDQIEQFLAGKRCAVIGASADRAKYGNKALLVD
jgi:hypothetical protein